MLIRAAYRLFSLGLSLAYDYREQCPGSILFTSAHAYHVFLLLASKTHLRVRDDDEQTYTLLAKSAKPLRDFPF